MDDKLRNALVAAREGDEARARLILAEYLRAEPNNVAAWVLLSKLAASDVQKAAFLRKVLELDPQHAYARQALQELGQAPAPVISTPAASVEERDEPALPVDALPQPVQEPTTPYHEEVLAEERPAADDGIDDDLFEDFFAQPSLRAEEFEEQVATEEPDWDVSDESDDFDVQAGGGSIPPWVDVDSTMLETPSSPASAPEADLSIADNDELPEWLREEGADDWLDEETEARYTPVEEQDDIQAEQTASEKAARLSAAMAMAPEADVVDESGGRGWLLILLLIIAAVIFLMLVYAVLTAL